jgi:uncharacterized protein
MNFNSAVIKVTSRCNLNCTYCYLYNMGDDTYLTQPKVLSNKVMDAFLENVKLHCRETGLKEFHFIFQGGEPLLARREFYERFVDVANDALRRIAQPRFSIETNGLLLTEEWCNLFAELNIEIRISLDGLKRQNDHFRPDLKGKGSYDRVMKGLKVALKNSFHRQHLRILSVMNPDSDPVETYAHIKQLQVAQFDVLLPAANYDSLKKGIHDLNGNRTPYADWLISLFTEWQNDPEPGKPEIGMFRKIINTFSGSADTEGFETSIWNRSLFIQTDGAISAHDALNSCGNGFNKTGFNVLSDNLSSASESGLCRLYMNSHNQLNKKCLACPVKQACQGGELHTRFSSSNGFNNPSIYCHDMMKLITHIQGAVSQHSIAGQKSVPAASLLTYASALSTIERNMSQVTEPEYGAELESFSSVCLNQTTYQRM